MRCLIASIVGLLLLGQPCEAGLSLHVAYQADPNRPLALAEPNDPSVYEDIMVGTHIELVISSDDSFPWGAMVALHEDCFELARLSGLGQSPDGVSFPDSVLAAAGQAAGMALWLVALDGLVAPPAAQGLWLLAQAIPDQYPMPGPWFLLDYTATAVGQSGVLMYVGDTSLPEPFVLGATCVFNQVPTRDFDGNSRVDFGDFALWAGHWLAVHPADPNVDLPCTAAGGSPVDPNFAVYDLDGDWQVGASDLGQFCRFWLVRTSGVESADANDPDGHDPNGL